MPYGRGGAGNIEASQWDAAAYAATFKQKLADDIEAQTTRAGTPPTQGATTPSQGATLSPSPAPTRTSSLPSGGDVQKTAVTSSSAQQEYAHTGRGGAGNWYSPKTLDQTGTFSTSSSSDSPSSGTPTTTATEDSTVAPPRPPQREPSTGTQHRGRGGAGNFVYSEEQQQQQQQQQYINDKAENEKREIELQDMVKGGVDAGLARPGRVYMGGGREETDQGQNAEALRTLWS